MNKKNTVYIFGHKNPDTDSICSSIAYAHLKRETGMAGAKAFRLGNISQETEFALKYFNVETPDYLADVKQRVEDLDIYKPVTICQNQPVKMAWDMMRGSQGSRLVPITCEENKLKGIIGMGDVTKIFMEESEEEVLSLYEVLYSNLITILDGRKIGGEYKYEKLSGAVYIGTVPEDVTICDKDILISSNPDKARELIEQYDFGCLILTRSTSPKGMENAGCAIVCVDASTFKTVSLVKRAISVGSIMNEANLITFSQETYVDDVISVMRGNRYRNFPVVNKDGTLDGIISRRHVMGVSGKKVIMIDHNERNQSVEGLEQAEIIEVIDHHRLADIQTASPIYSRIEPVGCTSTIVYKMYKENGVNIPKDMAGMMLSAILSDTLKFSSPTSTSQDEAAAKDLAGIAGVNLEDYALEMFEAGTNVDKMTIDHLLSVDRKHFTFGTVEAYISQINVMNFESMLHREKEICAELDKFYDEHDECSLVMFMITDIVHNGSELFAVGKDKHLMEATFGMKPSENHIFLPGVVSRKKQIIPTLTKISTSGVL
ncbi:MAG: putative manganese-dependent inorganic diphosphatase [Defluviitaleaceae bacterium]|nr:putative manganese-dependent inorganic diphosphatase [Defluviitaleaceae bacterium]